MTGAEARDEYDAALEKAGREYEAAAGTARKALSDANAAWEEAVYAARERNLAARPRP